LILSPIVAACYFGVYATAYYSSFKPVRNELEHKRTEIIAQWARKYTSIVELFDSLTSEEILTIAKKNPKEGKFFRLLQILFATISLTATILAAVFGSLPEDRISKNHYYILLGIGTLYVVTFSIVLFMTIYESRYVNIIEKHLPPDNQN
jgi:hypothetical protein